MDGALPFHPADRMARLPGQFFAALIAAADTRRQAGHDVINLGQGNPVDATPPHIVETLQRAAADVTYHRYVNFQGLPALKRAGAAWWASHHGVSLNPETEIAILIGVKVGLAELALTALNPGDRAAVPDPGYPDYWSGIALAGAERVSLPAVPCAADWSGLPPGVKLVFLNYPHNPTGQLGTDAVFPDAIAYARRSGAIVAHDLAYGDIVFDGQRARSFLATPGAREVGVEFLSLSKSYHMAGWRIGLAAGHPGVIQSLEQLQDHLHCSQFGAIQVAAEAALASPAAVTEAVAALYQRRRDAFIEPLQSVWRIPPPAGGIFLWAPVPGGGDGQELARHLLETANVVVAPGIGFGEAGRRHIRISLTATEARLREAAARIGAALCDWAPEPSLVR